jgi:hypothetical protein
MPQLAKWEPGAALLVAVLKVGLEEFIYLKKTISNSPAYFVNGNLFAGTQGKYIFLRLNKADRDYLLDSYEDSTLLEPVIGRTTKEYATVPYGLYSDTEAFRCWLKRAYDYTAALPPKIGIAPEAPRNPAARKRIRSP